VLRFSDNPEDYKPQVLVRWEGTEAFTLSPFIYAYQATDVAITGLVQLTATVETLSGHGEAGNDLRNSVSVKKEDSGSRFMSGFLVRMIFCVPA